MKLLALLCSFACLYSTLGFVLIGDEQIPEIKTKRSYSSCEEAFQAGHRETGLYGLTLPSRPNETPLIFCNITSSATGSRFARGVTAAAATTILFRFYGLENFQRGYNDYRNGFGTAKTDYWYGLDNMRKLIAQGNRVLRITMQDWAGNTRQATYKNFSISAYPDYRLFVSGFSGNVPDDMSYQNGYPFYTIDRPDPAKCVFNQKAGWWYNYCSYAFLTGRYYKNGYYAPTPSGFYDGVYWKDWMGFNYSLKYVSATLSSS